MGIIKRIGLNIIPRVIKLNIFGFRRILFAVSRLITTLGNNNLIFGMAEFFSFSEDELEQNKRLQQTYLSSDPLKLKSVNWFIQGFQSKYLTGGPNSILSLVRFFSKQGFKQKFVILGGKSDVKSFERELRLGNFGLSLRDCKVTSTEDWDKIEFSDISICTFWTTAYPLLKFNKTQAKYYFIQDDERTFYPSGSLFELAEQSYKFSFIGITNSLELKEWYEREFNSNCHFILPDIGEVNEIKRNSNNHSESFKKIWFYARPDANRNAYEIGMLALKKIKTLYPEIDITLAGSNTFKEPLFNFTDIGDIKDVRSLNDLYANNDLCLYFITSHHTGIIPFEVMKRGSILLTNRRKYSTYLLKDNFNCIMTDLSVNEIVESFKKIYNDKQLQKRIIEGGEGTVSKLNSSASYSELIESIKFKRFKPIDDIL